jgi:hypothetical protein
VAARQETGHHVDVVLETTPNTTFFVIENYSQQGAIGYYNSLNSKFNDKGIKAVINLFDSRVLKSVNE